MKELTIEKLVPLLASPVWYKRLVGEYYEVLIRQEGVRQRIATLFGRMKTEPSSNMYALQAEIELMQAQLNAMSQYGDVLRRRIGVHGIPYIEILSEVMDAEDVLTEVSEDAGSETD